MINQVQKSKYLILVDLLKKDTDYDAKIIKIKGKITGLVTTSALNDVKQNL